MKYTASHFILSFFMVGIIFFSGCKNKKIDPVIKYARQIDREETLDEEWKLPDTAVPTVRSPFIEYYEENPALCSLLSWELYLSEDTENLTNIHWLHVYEFINVQVYLAVKELVELLNQKPDTPVPGKYSFLIPMAQHFYELEDRKKPVSWTIDDLCSAFLSPAELFDTINTYYRETFMTSPGNLPTVILTQGDPENYEMKMIIRLDEHDTDSAQHSLSPNYNLNKGGPPESLFRDLTSFFNCRLLFPDNEQRMVVHDTHNSISVLFKKQPFSQWKNLTFHLVSQEVTDKFSWEIFDAENLITFLLNVEKTLPPGILVKIVLSRDKQGFPVKNGFAFIKEEVLLDTTHIVSANVQTDPQTMRPFVTFRLSPVGIDLLAKITQENKNEVLVIVLNDFIVFCARIMEPITNGKVQIRGQGIGLKEAKEIADYLNAK